MMLFFRNCIQSKSLTRHSNPRYLKKICAPLQVQICKIQIYLKKKNPEKEHYHGSPSKEALPWRQLFAFR